MLTAYVASAIHDGDRLWTDHAVLVRDGRVEGIEPARDVPPGTATVDLAPHILCPGFVDLQVNGGGGRMVDGACGPDGLRLIAYAHERLGTTTILPTLITDTPESTRAVIAAARAVIDRGDTRIAGLHLEGPHLSQTRKGAHDPTLVRPMEDADLQMLCEAAAVLPTLLLTVAPESVTPEQVAALARAGCVVSLGHTDADYETCRAAFRAGAVMATHLFNAMSQITGRNPGLVGAALDTPGIHAGLIADGHHVHGANLRLAHRAGGAELFLVTDAMAPAGTGITLFELNGRTIRRANDRLTLADGTLAGADLTMARAIGIMRREGGASIEEAIAMATGRPASRLRAPGTRGRFAPGAAFDGVALDLPAGLARRL